MKKKNWLLTIAFAVMSLAIVSTCVIGSTYAKFTSGINSSGKVQAAGFLITGGELPVNYSAEMVAPGETKETEVTINYFSQVVTDIAVAQAGVTITGTGVFDTVDPDDSGSEVSPWVALLTEYKGTTAGAADSTITTATALSDIFTVAIGSGSAATLAADFASAVVSAGTTQGITIAKVSGQDARLTAMGADERQAIEVSLTVNVTWTEKNNTFDTFLGNKIAELLQESTPVVSYINVSLPLTATQHTGS